MHVGLLHDVSNSLDAASTALSHPSTSTTRMRSNRHQLSILPRLRNNNNDGGGGGHRVIEGGRMRKRFNWKLAGTGFALFFLLVWALGPRERRKRMLDAVHPYPWPGANDVTSPVDEASSSSSSSERPISTPKPTPNPKPDTEKTLPERPPPKPSLTPSFQTDPDRTKTVYCTSPFSESSPLVQWALMIDAGSTGSRIHIYKFHNCHPAPEYEYEVFRNTQPGLSEFGEDAEGAEGAARSLDGLLEKAVEVVPEGLRSCTPVAVKATAGLRMLGVEKSTEILRAVRDRLMKYPFRVVEDNGVVIMDGKDEGVYAWITANYLMNTIRSTTPSDTPTFAVLDLGGGSTQIVFKPTLTESGAKLEEGEHKYRLEFGGKEHLLYQHSYLGYGLMSARKSVHRLVDFMHWPGVDVVHEVANPCLARGTRREVEVDDGHEGPGAGIPRNVTMVGADVGSFEACNRVVELVLAKDAICHVKPCSFNGVYQPSLLDTFPTGNILLLSYFYDRLAPLLSGENNDMTFPISTIARFAERVCLGRESWVKHWGEDPKAMAELEGRPEECLDLTFMHALLRLGYEFGEEREVRIRKKVDETELGWCLGATIGLLDGGRLECTA